MLAEWTKRSFLSVIGRESAQYRGRRAFALLSVGIVTGACTSILGIDGEYVSAVKESPDAGRGGPEPGGEGGSVSEAGGATGAGAAGSTGAGATGGTATTNCGSACGAGKKCCPGVAGTAPLCELLDPSVGCSLEACDPCPDAPANATAACNADGQCDFTCDAKFERVGDLCQPVATGGAGGVTGAGGTSAAGGQVSGTGGAPACVANKCPSFGGPIPGCSIASPFGCCAKDGRCGCSYVGMAYCL